MSKEQNPGFRALATKKSEENKRTYIVMDDTPKLHILAVEDDEINRHLLVEIMTKYGHNLHIVATGEAAIQKLYTNEYDAVLTDRQLPDIPGDKVAEIVKEINSQTPVIMVTGGDIRTEPGKRPQNVDHVVPKPYNVKDLGRRISEVVNERRADAQEGDSLFASV